MNNDLRLRLALVDKAIKIAEEATDDPRQPAALETYRQQRREILEQMAMPPVSVGIKTLKLTAKRG